MDDYISLSALNDFIFCPYSIYLHNVYMESDKDIFQAVPQTTGKIAHRTIDLQTAKGGKFDLAGISVQSEELKIRGKIDLYRFNKKLLVERKYQLKQIFRGQLYQLWGEYFCMVEMGYKVKIKSNFAPKFSGSDSIMLFVVDDADIEKYGNAIHRDKDLLVF